MNASYKRILEWVRDEVPELLDLDETDAIDPESATGRAAHMVTQAGLMLDPYIASCSDSMLPVLVELNRIAPEQDWTQEWDPVEQEHYLSAGSGCTEIRVNSEERQLTKRIRHEWTVWTIGPCEGTGPEDPAPSVDDVFKSTSPLDVARRAAVEEYTATIHYA